MASYPLVAALQAAFEGSANSQVAAGQRAYLKNRFEFLGMTAPLRRKLQLPLFRQHPLTQEQDLIATMEALWALPFRDYHQAALDLAEHHQALHTPAMLPVFKGLALQNQWWDSIDYLAGSLISRLALKYPELSPEIAGWIAHDNFWLRRVAILFQLKHKAKTDESLLFSLCEQTMHEKEFFIRKAIGWALREYAKTSPQAVWAFTQANRATLSGLSYREATRRIVAEFESKGNDPHAPSISTL